MGLIAVTAMTAGMGLGLMLGTGVAVAARTARPVEKKP